MEGLIGFFVNTLVLRTDLSGDPSFVELLGRVRETALGAYAHQDLPFEQLVEELAPVRDLSRNPLVQVMFQLMNAPRQRLDLVGAELGTFGTADSSTRFDLECHLVEHGDSLVGRIIYSVDLFTAATAERLAGHFRTLLAAVVEHPDRRLSEVDMMPAGERDLVLTTWRGRRRPATDATLPQFFEAQVERSPEAVAVRHETGDLTYAQLNALANRLARALVDRGVGPERQVALMIPRSVHTVVSSLAVVKAGGAYLPVDPGYPAERVEYMLRAPGPRAW